MAQIPNPGALGLASWRRIAGVAAILVAITILWIAIGEASVGVSFLFLVPVALAANMFGRRGGVVAGLAAGVLYGLAGTVVDEPSLMLGTLVRGGVYVATGWLVGLLLEQRIQLRGEVARAQRELAELRAIQEALVPPEMPDRPGLELASCYVPAEAGVAGDFHFVAEGPSGSTVVVVGDVVGHGIDAARRASFVRTALATFASFTDDPVRLLEMANTSLLEKAGTSEQFVTACCVTHMPGSGRVAWALAGHAPPRLLDTGQPLEGAEPGVPLGIDVELGCTPAALDLSGGGGLLLYTDGLSEARSARPADGEQPMLGDDRVGELLAAMAGAEPDAIVQELRAAAEAFAGGALADDLCLVALRATSAPESRPASRPDAESRPRAGHT